MYAFTSLLSCGFDERGAIDSRRERIFENSLMLALCAQLKCGVFSHIAACVPELRAVRPLISVLPDVAGKRRACTPG